MKVIAALATTLVLVVAAWATFSSGQRPRQAIQSSPLLRPIAEFEHTFAIGLSEQILSKASGPALLRSILAADAKVYLFISRDREEEIEASLQQIFHSQDLLGITRIQLEHETLWLRDYLPLPILKLYPHLTPTPSFVDFVYRDGNSFDDAAIHQFALSINSSVEHLPIVLDGGNFMTNGDTCILSTEVSEDPEVALSQATEKPLSAYIGEVFRQAMGCRQTLTVSQVPHPHVDMWLKFLDPKTVLVNAIDARAKALTSALEPHEQEKISKISEELDRTAELLEKEFRVVRVPMPLPVNDYFLSYANALLVNGKAIIPRYVHPDKDGRQPDKDLFPSYEEEVAGVFKRYGYDATFVEADDLIRDGGAFHCVSFHLPDLDSILKDRSHLAIRSKG